MIDVSIIIVSYNVRPFLQRALESLSHAKSGLELEVIVVDNDSEDTSVEMVRSRFPQVEVIETGENLGFAKANNLALKRASGRYLMLLNPDCVLKEDSLVRLVEFLDSHPRAGAVGPKLLNRDGTFQTTSKRGFPTPWAAFCKLSGLSGLFPRSKFFNHYELGHLDPDQAHRVEVLTGAALMIRREVYDQVGGLDEDYFMYGEDIDWCHMIGQAGWEIHYVPASQIIHYKGESTRRSNIDREKHFYNAMRLFSRKHSRLDLVTRIAIELGIFTGELMARLKRSSGVWLPAMLDLLLIFGSLLLVFYLRFTFFPSVWGPPPIPITSAMWLVSLLYAVVTTASLAFLGVYETRPASIRLILFGVVIGFALVSTVAYFVRPIQFSRVVISVGGALVLTLLPGWRFLVRRISGGDRSRRVVIVGTDTLAEVAAERIRTGQIRGMEVIGWIVYDQDELGGEIRGLPVLGTAVDLPELAEEHRLDEALFSSRSASYEDIFRIVTRRPVKGLGIQIIPEGFDREAQMPLLELEIDGGIFRNLVRSRAPHLVMRDR